MRVREAALGIGAIIACTTVASATDGVPQRSRPPEPPRAGWAHPLGADHGIRADRAGLGHFGAKRYHGKHNGLDLLAPIGTAVRAVCEGKARGGKRSSFGNYVHLVCELPSELAGEDPIFASVFYAHLQIKKVPHEHWVKVQAGDEIGAVGKTGNAKSATVMPHLHLEVILHDDRSSALSERHSGRNQSNTAAADRFMKRLQSGCFEKTGLESKGPWRRARRADPFAVLACASEDKPALTEPPPPLEESWRKWSSQYHADTFDVDASR
jgi:murein DD-endopeptidase MepM/ murein hydrolase activator NlpD